MLNKGNQRSSLALSVDIGQRRVHHYKSVNKNKNNYIII